MEQLEHLDIVHVQQKKEFAEILTGIETKNRYQVLDEEGGELYRVGEESSFFLRMLLRNRRPFTLLLFSMVGETVLQMNRVFRFFMQRMEISDGEGRPLGVIQQRFVWFARKFEVIAPDGRILFETRGPWFKPWTFNILHRNQEVGVISKKWSGLGKELFTDADNFTAKFPQIATTEEKALLLSALFLIDMLYFESRN